MRKSKKKLNALTVRKTGQLLMDYLVSPGVIHVGLNRKKDLHEALSSLQISSKRVGGNIRKT